MIVRREELFTAEVDEAISREQRLRQREAPESPPVSPLRRLLMSNLFYLPLAGLIGGLCSWAILEPRMSDHETVGGPVVLINSDPIDDGGIDPEFGNAVVLTVGTKEVVVLTGQTRLEEGVEGQRAFADVSRIEPGDFVEVAGLATDLNRILAFGLRPATREQAELAGQQIEGAVTLADIFFFPLTAVLVALGLLLAEGISSRNWVRMIERLLLGGLLTAVFAFLAYIPAGMLLGVGQIVLEMLPGFVFVHDLPALYFLAFAAARSAAWACLGGAMGLGMNLVRSTKLQRRNAVIGGALGGALGGLFFDPIQRFLIDDSVFKGAELSRIVGLLAVGLSVGVFVALVDRLAREAWVRVKTGPLTGKSFVLYRTPTTIGSSPGADIYLFKDAGIAPTHAEIHRVGNSFEIEALESEGGTTIGGERVRRRRLTSGDQIVVSNTVLEFEERPKRVEANRGT